MNPKAHHIGERFPDQKHTLDLLMEKDPEFLVLCEDHDACVDALLYWAKSKDPEAETRVHEYRTLIRELQEEITQILVVKKPPLVD